MEIRIMARHFDLTDSLRSYIEQKITRVLRHAGEVMDVLVVMSTLKIKDRTKQNHVEVNIYLRGKHIVAEEAHFDMYAAIDAVSDKLDRQAVKNNRIKHAHHHDKHAAFIIAEKAQLVAESTHVQQME